MKIPYPELSGTPEQQLAQLKTWLFRLVELLNLEK